MTFAARRGLGCAVLAAAVALLSPGPVALAQDTEMAAESRARGLFERGAEAYAQGRYDEAISLFQTGDRLAPRAAFSYNLAVAYEGKGETARALEHYRNYQRRGVNPSEREAIQLEIARLEKALAFRGVQQVSIHVSETSVLVVDGKEVGSSPWTGELTPGTHKLVVRPAGAEPIETTFELPGTRAVDVRVDTSGAGSTQPFEKPLAWALLGVTGVTATAGAVLGGVAWSNKSSLDDMCGPEGDSCPAGSEGEIETFRTTRTLSYVSFGLAVAGAAGATVLFVRDAQEDSTTQVSLSPADQGLYVSLRHSF